MTTPVSPANDAHPSPRTPPLPETKPLTAPILILMAAACGLAVASNYYVQPLLHTISLAFGLSSTQAGSLVTAAQLSYAAGLLFLVPLGDLFERRALIVVMALLAAGGLLITAFAPNIHVMLLGSIITGIFSVTAQVLVPFVATLAAPEQRGRAVGMVMAGLLMGILLARTVAGALAELGSWRTVYWVAAVLMTIMAALLYRNLPRYRVNAGLSYVGLLRSVLQLFGQEPLFRARAILSGLMFAIFSVFWTSMTFLLAGPPFELSDGVIGAFGLAGLAGALAATVFGRRADQGHANASTRIALLLMMAAWAVLILAQVSLTAMLVGVVLLDLAVQGVHITNQSTIYRIRPEARSRLTSGYMTCCFVGGALGSQASASIYAYLGWPGVVGLGMGLSLIAAVYGMAVRSARIPDRIEARN